MILRTLLDLALVCLFFIPLERLRPRRDVALFARHRLTDWLHALLTPWLVAGLVLGIAAVAGPFLRANAPARLHALVADFPRAVSFGLAFLLAELAAYGVHYAMHRIPLLWHFHAVHHSAEELDFLAGIRRHPFDTALSSAAIALPGFLLGVPLEGIALYGLATKLWTIFIHTNLDVRIPVLERLVTTPFFHHGHHDRQEVAPRNLASVLAVLDVLFGTYRERTDWPLAYGTEDRVSRSWLGQIFVRPRWNSGRATGR